LIEVAAQHPLVNGTRPGVEFSSRLDLGKSLYDELTQSGRDVELYVPGSIHVHEGRPDKISLSKAGRLYLEALGVPSTHIHGDDLNDRYKGREGVYGSADECFVAARYFTENPFGLLVSVVSPAQMLRKTLHYIEFGVVPLNHTAPTCESYHNYLYELFEKIPHVLLVDRTLQDGASGEAQRLRDQRMPGAQAIETDLSK
jgi:hypothetical protein